MNKDNKKLVIMVYLIMIVIAITGPIIAIKQSASKDELETDNYYDNDKYYDNDENDKNDNYEDLDSYLEKYTYTFSKNDRERLINSTNFRDCMSEEIYGAMFNEKISDNFKLIYTANELIRFIGRESGQAAIAGKVTIKEETLLENANKIFSEVEIPSTFNTKLHYFGTYKLSCTNGRCTFIQDTFGSTSLSPVDGYETKIIESGSILQTKVIYIEEEMIDYNDDTEIYKINAKLYDKHNGTLLKTIENYEIDLSQNINIYDEFSPHYKNIDQFIYLFDEDNRLLLVRKSKV